MMYIDAQPPVSPEVLQSLKKDIMSSLHVALPGIVESYDPYAGTVDVLPAVRSRMAMDGEPVIYPVLREVPVFVPKFTDPSIVPDIQQGDMCLLIFADVNIDSWYDTGQAAMPTSGRQHDLSDAFAFVGFHCNGRQNGGDRPGLSIQ